MDSTTVTLGDFVFHEIENAKEEGVTCAHLSSLFKAAEIEIRRCLLDLLGMGLVVQHDNNWKLKRQYEEDEAVSAVQRDIGKLSLGDNEKTHQSRTHMAVATRPPTEMICSNPDVQINKNAIGKIAQVLSVANDAMLAKDIAQKSGLGQSRADVNGWLYFMKERNIVDKVGKCWRMKGKLSPSDIDFMSNELAKINPSKKMKELAEKSPSQKMKESQTHMAVATRPSTEMICSNPDVQINKNAIGKIAQVLSVANDAMLAKDIAQKSGLGQSRADVNGWLYFMKERNIVEQVGKCWRMKGKLSPSDIDFMSIELAKINPSKKMKELAEKSPSQKMKDGKACHSILSAERLHTMPNQRDLGKISQRIGREFEQLGLELGLIKAEIDQIRINNPLHIKDVIFNMLLTWEEKFGMNATFGCLENAMIAVGIDTIEVFKDIDHW